VERCGEKALRLEEVSGDELTSEYDFSAEFAQVNGIGSDETAAKKMRAVPDDSKCVRCGYCTRVCPVFALKVY
jgi:ferredoxin